MIKKTFLLITISFSLTSCLVHTKGEDGKPGTPGKDRYTADSKIIDNQKPADSLGADKYRMKP